MNTGLIGILIILGLLMGLLGIKKKKDDFDTKNFLGKSVLEDFDKERRDIDNLMR